MTTYQRRKTAFLLLILLMLNSVIILAVQNAEAASYQQGSQGETVKDIQQVLKKLGLYNAAVDGIYGTKTKSAVIAFQKNCGIQVDGICGPVTLKYLGLGTSTSSSSYSSNLELLANIISAEGRGEEYRGQVAIGAVILNRVKHPSFPNTIAGVIYQKGAFTAVDDGQIHAGTTDTSRRAAADALNGSDPTGGCIYYFNPAKATSKWIWSREQVITIGKHIFCR